MVAERSSLIFRGGKLREGGNPGTKARQDGGVSLRRKTVSVYHGGVFFETEHSGTGITCLEFELEIGV